MFNRDFALVNPVTLQVQVMARFQLNNLQYNLIPIVSSLAGIPAVLIAAVMLDKLGSRFSISFFVILAIAGLSILAFSAIEIDEPVYRNFLIGRALFGMGYTGQVMWLFKVIQ